MKYFLISLISILVFSACKKNKSHTQDQLPPATQVGANTFGCKINGKVFVPKGYDGTGRPNPHIIYDIGLDGKPYLFIETHKYANNNSIGGVDITFFELTNVGNYLINDKFRLSVGSQEFLGNCGISISDTTVKRSGGGVISRLDLANRVISGTFDCKFKRIDCDTVFITDGRFDIKF